MFLRWRHVSWFFVTPEPCVGVCTFEEVGTSSSPYGVVSAGEAFDLRIRARGLCRDCTSRVQGAQGRVAALGLWGSPSRQPCTPW